MDESSAAATIADELVGSELKVLLCCFLRSAADVCACPKSGLALGKDGRSRVLVEEEEVVEPVLVLLLSLAGVEEVEAMGEAEAEVADTAEAGGGGREMGRVGATVDGLLSEGLRLLCVPPRGEGSAGRGFDEPDDGASLLPPPLIDSVGTRRASSSGCAFFAASLPP